MTQSTTDAPNAPETSTSLAEGLEANFVRLHKIMQGFVSTHGEMGLDPFNIAQAYSSWLAAAARNPHKLAEANMQFWQDAMKLYHQTAFGLFGRGAGIEPVVQEHEGDRRFHHEAWAEAPIFDAIKQSYLLGSQWMRKLVSDVQGLDEKEAQKVEFFTERFLEAMSPTNFAHTNPAVLDRVIETKGANLVDGLKNMLSDFEAGDGQLRIKMTDHEAFELGKNIAMTPGKVVYQNRMFQLIQYSPTTETTFSKPLLIVPPWINKFYILDLQPKNSMLRWLVEQGHTVFVISWINPDESYRDTGFEDYVKEGVLEAVDQVQAATGEDRINAIGYCIGGTLLTTSLAYMRAKGDRRIASATFFTTMLDFSDPGELGVFIDDSQVSGIEKKMEKDGYLEGSSMSGTFNLLRANDLIWSFYVNNYLMGNEARPFDILYWNSDSTRMPAAMHSWYLRNLYLENKLIEPGAIEVDGVGIDIGTIDIPVCFVSTIEDHIAPWLSTYAGAQRFPGPVRFILGGSGHIAGIVNPPAKGKYDYRVLDGLRDDLETWADEAEVHKGSWWPAWQDWIAPQAGDQVPARIPGSGALDIVEDAPGVFVVGAALVGHR